MKQFLILCGSFLLIIGCAKQNAQKKPHTSHDITINIASEPATLDPRKAASTTDINIIRTFCEGLVRVGPKGTATMALADHITLSGDKKSYRIALKETLWSNGDPLTAHDFVATYKQTISNSPSLLPSNPLLSLKNARPIQEGTLPQSFLGVRAENDYTLVLELETPLPYFVELLAHPAFFPVHPKCDFEKKFITNGPFVIKDWIHQEKVETIKNPLYWDARGVHLEVLCMVMLEETESYTQYKEHKLDWEGAPFTQLHPMLLAEVEARYLHKDPLLGTYWVQPNPNVFPLHSAALRSALALTVNPQEIIVAVGNEGKHLTPQIRKVWQETEEDSMQALHLLQESIAEGGIDIDNISLTLTYPADNKNHKIAQSISNQWINELGIAVQLDPLPMENYLQRISTGDYQLACGSWVAEPNDPLSYLELYKVRHLGQSQQWESPNYQQALQDAFLPPEDSLELADAESSIIPLFRYNMLHVQNENLKGVILTDSGMIDFRWAYTE